MNKMIIFLLGSFFLFSCGTEYGTDGLIPEKKTKEITIKAGVGSRFLRSAPINSIFTTNFLAGIYANKSGTWTAGSTNVINNDLSTVLGALPHNVSFAGTYYYPIDGSTVNIYAYAPQGTESTAATAGSAAANAPQVTIAMTGQEDIMWATASGNKSSAEPSLGFSHKLTQLQFTFISSTGFPTGTTVTSLLLKSQPSSAVMNVQTGACTFSGSAGMQAIQSGPVSIAVSPGTNANSPIMTQAGNSVTLDVTVQPSSGAAYTYTNVAVSGLTTVAGSAHMVTLTFTGKQITATATVTAWATGTGGAVTI